MTGILSSYYLDLLEERISSVRQAVGDNIDIIMENHSNLDANSAVQIAAMAEKYKIFFFEEPSTPNPKMTKAIRERISIPISHGERIFTRWQYAPYFENNSIQVIQPDIGTCGGLTEAKKICDMAYVYDVAVQAHVCASPLSTAVALHLESVIPNFIIHEHHRNCLYPHNKKLCTVDYQPEKGWIKSWIIWDIRGSVRTKINISISSVFSQWTDKPDTRMVWRESQCMEMEKAGAMARHRLS